MRYTYNTGGQTRSLNSGYCAVRAVAIATGMDWKSAEKHVREYARRGMAGNGQIARGVYKDDFDAALRALGWRWHSAPRFEGRKAVPADLSGVVIARQAKHFTAVIDGTVNDIWDCSQKMVYGYWSKT